MKTQLNAPQWDLNSIYSSFESKEFVNDLKELDSLQNDLMNHFNSQILSTDFPQWVKLYTDKFNRLLGLFISLHTFCYAKYSCETTNSAFINKLSLLEEKNIAIQQVEIKFRTLFSQVVGENPQIIKELFTSYPQLRKYEYIFNEELYFSKHQMNSELEKLASELELTGSESFSRLQEQIISNLSDKETGKTFNEIRNEAYSPDRNVRQNAFKKEIELLKSSEIPLAACLNNIKGTTITLNKRRGFENPLQKTLAQSRMSQKTLEALISSIENSLPFWRDYLDTKAKILFGNNENSKLDFCDLFAPLPNTKKDFAEKIWSFSDAKDYIIERFNSFSTDMGNFAKNAFEKGWIDAEVRKGKVGGAYCIDFPLQKESRVLSNFTGTFSDITTLAHELGHGYHFYCVKDLDVSFTQYPMTLAETASNFAETIVQKDIIANSQGYEKANMIETHLQDSCQVLVDILSRFYFEKEVFEKRKERELSAQDFCDIMINAQQKTYGNSLNVKHPYMWSMKCHYYSPSLDFYNFPYAFGMLFSSGLYARFEKEGAAFATIYKDLLKETGRISCEEVCKTAGFDIENESFWKSGIDSLKNELDELKKYANESK